MGSLTRKEELTYRFDVQVMTNELKKEKRTLKRKARRDDLKAILKEWHDKKYPQPKEL